MYRLGVIGSGDRMTGIVRRILRDSEICLAAVADPRIDAMKQKYAECEGTAYYASAEEMFANEKLDAVCIGTRCSMHTQLALMAAQYNIPIFLEKPVCTNEADYQKLETILHLSDKIVVSFPLRFCTITRKVRELIEEGKIGTVQHVQAYNNVPYGKGYYHKWYRDENETGGMFLQKATHDFDYINYLLGDNRPVSICAMNSKQIYKGDMPAGLRCRDCDRRAECYEDCSADEPIDYGYRIMDYCAFATDTGNEDSGSAIVQYESGMHTAYSQNFFARYGAGKRGARLIGYFGTLEFDFYTATIKIYHHFDNSAEEIYMGGDDDGHFGGDDILVGNFLDVIKGKATSCATLESGLTSVRMCLAAKKSAQQHIFCDI